jgi:hypothetical protein
MEPENRRSHVRLEREEALLVRRHPRGQSADEDPTLVRGTSTDVSAGGLRLSAPVRADPGEALDLWVSWTPNGRKYLLAAHVRWCSHMPGHTQLGVALTESPGTDYLDWRGLFESQLRLVRSEGED